LVIYDDLGSYIFLSKNLPNGLRYLRWGVDGEAVQPEKCWGVKKLKKRCESPASGARGVGRLMG
jgi:hypothetical protein